MRQIALFLVCALIISGCGYDPGKRAAVANFNARHEAIEAFEVFYRGHPGIDYVEFRKDNTVDLWVLDRDRFDQRAGQAIFKFELFAAPIASTAVRDALEYASVTMETFLQLKEYAAKASCVSVQKPFRDSDAAEIEIGFARQGMSKWIYRKLKHEPIVKDRDYVAPLTGNWILVTGRPAFN